MKAFHKRKNGQLLAVTDVGIVEIFSEPDTAYFKTLLEGAKSEQPQKVFYPKSIYEDKQQNLWISEAQSIVRYSKTGALKRYFLPEKTKTESFIRSYAVAQQQDGTIWAASFSGNLFYLDATQNFREIDLKNTPISNIADMLFVSDNQLFIASHQGLYVVQIHADKTVSDIQLLPHLPQSLSDITLRNDKLYLISWEDKLHEYDLKTQKIHVFEDFPNGIRSNRIYSAKADEYWVSTDEGVILMQKTCFDNFPLNDNLYYLQSITQSPDNRLFMSDEVGVYEVMLRHGQKISRQIQNREADKTGMILDLIADQNTLWASSAKGMVFRMSHEGQIQARYDVQGNGNAVFSIEKDENQNIWACLDLKQGMAKITPEGALKYYQNAQGLSTEIEVVRRSPNGLLWCAGRGKSSYLYIYDAENDRFKNISPKINFAIKGNFYVNDMAFDAQNVIWLGTSAGLLKYDGKTLQKISLGYKNADASEVRAVLVHTDGSVWLGGTYGIIRFQESSKEAVLFDENAGLPAKSTTFRSLFLDTQNRLWAGTSKGGVFSQMRMSNLTQTKSPLFTKLKINGKAVDLKAETVETFPGNSYFEADFIALSYPGNHLQYQVRLVNINAPDSTHDGWQSISKKSDIYIPQLTKGSYLFETRAKMSGGYLWSQPIAFRFHIQTVWYKTWQAMTLFVVIAGLLLWIGIRLNTLRLVHERNRLEKIVQQRTSEIREKNTELEKQKEEIILKNEQLKLRQAEIEAQNESIIEQRDELSKAYGNIQLLSEIGQAITSTFDFDTINRTIYDYVNSLMDAPRFGIGFYDQAKQLIEFRGLIEKGQTLPNYYDKMTEKDRLSVWCITHKKPVIINDLELETQNYLEVETFAKAGHTPASIIYLPLINEQKIVGVITVHSFQQNAYTEKEVNLLKTLASYIAIAIDNAGAYEEIHKKNEDITSSIRYAKTIQQAILVSPDTLPKNIIKDYFVLYRPKDIVSGDYYWFAQLHKYSLMMATVDCTGHGVPGAFMSMIGNTLLNEIVKEKGTDDPARVLEYLHYSVRQALHQDEGVNDDGMDVCICRIDKSNEAIKIAFAGAKRPLFYYKSEKSTLCEIKGTIKSIGGAYRKREAKHFVTEYINLEENDVIYLTSDGLIDQNNPELRKFGSITFKKKLAEIGHLALGTQRLMLEEALDQHQGGAEQRDDITIIGVKI